MSNLLSTCFPFIGLTYSAPNFFMHEEKFSVTLGGTRKFFLAGPFSVTLSVTGKFFLAGLFLHILRLKASLHFPLCVFLGDIITLVVELLASRQANFHLHKASLKVDLKRNQGESLLLYF